MQTNGRVTEVYLDNVGSTLVEDALTGATELHVVTATDFDEKGGQLTVGDDPTVYDYEIVGELPEYDRLVISPGLAADAEEGSTVSPEPYVEQKIASVRLEDEDSTTGSEMNSDNVEASLSPLVADGFETGPRREGVGEYVLLDNESGEWEVVKVYGREGTVRGENIVGPLSNDVELDSEAPASSPAAVASPRGIGGVQVSWLPTAFARAYDVYASLTPGVTTGSFLVGSIAGTSLSFDRIDDVRIPMDGSLVYVAIVARNDAGAAPIGAEDSAAAKKADLEELNVDQLNANMVETITAFIGDLTTDIITTNGKIIIGNTAAAHIVIDPLVGLLMYAMDGTTVQVRLDMTSAQLSEFTGKINASQLSVLNGLELRGLASRMIASSRLTLASTLDNPASKPTLTQSFQTQPWWVNGITGNIEYGAHHNATSNTWWVLHYKADTNRAVVRQINPTTGVPIGDALPLRNDNGLGDDMYLPNGVVQLGSYLYVLRRGTGSVGSREWWLIRYSMTLTGSDVNPLDAELIGYEDDPSGNNTPVPSVGTDGTNIIVSSMNTKTYLTGLGTSGYTGIVRYYASTLDYLDSYSVLGNIGAGLFGRGVGMCTPAGMAGPVVYFGTTPATGSEVLFYDISGATLVPNARQKLVLDGSLAYTVFYGPGNFYSSVGGSTLTRYSTFWATTTANKRFWASYDYRNGASWTLPSPKESLLLDDGKWLTIGVALPPAGTTLDGVFAGRGVFEPVNADMWEVGTTTGASVVISAGPTTGNHPRTVSDFNSGTPAEIMSQIGGFLLKGDGTGDWPLMGTGWVPCNSTTNFSTPASPSVDQFSVSKAGGTVCMTGLLTRTTSTLSAGVTQTCVGAIPAGFRPRTTVPFYVVGSAGNLVAGTVLANGDLTITPTSAMGVGGTVRPHATWRIP